jgi:hypothetical protein
MMEAIIAAFPGASHALAHPGKFLHARRLLRFQMKRKQKTNRCEKICRVSCQCYQFEVTISSEGILRANSKSQRNQKKFSRAVKAVIEDNDKVVRAVLTSNLKPCYQEPRTKSQEPNKIQIKNSK